MLTPGIPKDLGDEALRRMARSFYVVRMVRYALLAIAALGIAAVSAAEDTPVVVPAVLVVLAAMFAAAMVGVRRHYVSSQRRPSGSPASR